MIGLVPAFPVVLWGCRMLPTRTAFMRCGKHGGVVNCRAAARRRRGGGTPGTTRAAAGRTASGAGTTATGGRCRRVSAPVAAGRGAEKGFWGVARSCRTTFGTQDRGLHGFWLVDPRGCPASWQSSLMLRMGGSMIVDGSLQGMSSLPGGQGGKQCGKCQAQRSAAVVLHSMHGM